MSSPNDVESSQINTNVPPPSGGPLKPGPNGDVAEAADRAEGNKRVPAEREANEQRKAGNVSVERNEGQSDIESEEEMELAQELKRLAAAEDHQRVAAERGKGLHGRL